MEKVLDEKWQIRVSIKSVTEIKMTGKVPFIVTDMENSEDKIKIIERNSKFKNTRIYIDNDRTKQERLMHAMIRKKASEEKKAGKESKIFYRRTLVNGNFFSME